MTAIQGAQGRAQADLQQTGNGNVISIVERDRRAKWWRRRGSKKCGFWYQDADGKKIVKGEALERIASLFIPPAWKHVRINPRKGGRLQAVGVDPWGGVQYLYHPQFAARQQMKKYNKV